MTPYKTLLLSSLFCVATLMFATTTQAYPGDRYARGNRMNATTNRSGTYQRLNGGSGTFNQSVTRTPGSATGSTTWTNAKGGTGSHTFDNTWNKSTDTGTHESSTTYADGKTSSSQGDWTKTGTGAADYTGTHTGVNGQTTDVSKSVSDVSGVKTVDSTYTNPTTGKSSTVDKTISGGQVDTTATGPNGKTVTSDQTYAKTSDGYTQTGTVTGPNGKTSTDNHDVSYTTGSNGQITRTATGSVTGPNGNTKDFGNTETYTKTVTPNPAPTNPSQPPVD
jgi:hypothetical protein